MIVVGAMSSDRVIGSGHGMPWDVPEEYDHFLHLIEGKTIIIGRKSYEIFGGNLSSRHHIVVSRSPNEIDGAIVVPSIERAMQVAEGLGGEYFSAGGATIYAQTISLADTMYLSYIKGKFNGDAYFPEFSAEEWAVVRRDDHPRFEFVVYRRRVG
jgi:dihydrofolate reductase